MALMLVAEPCFWATLSGPSAGCANKFPIFERGVFELTPSLLPKPA